LILISFAGHCHLSLSYSTSAFDPFEILESSITLHGRKRGSPNTEMFHSLVSSISFATKEDNPQNFKKDCHQSEKSLSQHYWSNPRQNESKNAILSWRKWNTSLNKYNGSLQVLEDTLETVSSKFGQLHPLVGATHHNIGVLRTNYSLMAPCPSVAESFKLLAIQSFFAEINVIRHNLGHNHADVAALQNTIGMIQMQIRRFQDAISSFMECLRLRLVIFGRNHRLVAKIYNNLGVAHLLLGSSEYGLQAFENAYRIQSDHMKNNKNTTSEEATKKALDVSNTLCNIGSLCLDWSETKNIDNDQRKSLILRSISSFQEAVEIRTKVLGESHFLVEEAKNLKSEAAILSRENADMTSNLSVVKLEGPDKLRPRYEQLMVDENDNGEVEEICVVSSTRGKYSIYAKDFPFDEIPRTSLSPCKEITHGFINQTPQSNELLCQENRSLSKVESGSFISSKSTDFSVPFDEKSGYTLNRMTNISHVFIRKEQDRQCDIPQNCSSRLSRSDNDVSRLHNSEYLVSSPDSPLHFCVDVSNESDINVCSENERYFESKNGNIDFQGSLTRSRSDEESYLVLTSEKVHCRKSQLMLKHVNVVENNKTRRFVRNQRRRNQMTRIQ
jgi:hypothetical protein